MRHWEEKIRKIHLINESMDGPACGRPRSIRLSQYIADVDCKWCLRKARPKEVYMCMVLSCNRAATNKAKSLCTLHYNVIRHKKDYAKALKIFGLPKKPKQNYGL